MHPLDQHFDANKNFYEERLRDAGYDAFVKYWSERLDCKFEKAPLEKMIFLA